MHRIKGKVPVAVILDKHTCYRLRTGRCSLDIVGDFELAAPVKTGAADLLYCPRIYRAMRDRERERRLSVTPCACGHAELALSPQKACIAARCELEVLLQPAECEPKELCFACGRQLTFDEDMPDREGAQLYELHAVAEAED